MVHIDDEDSRLAGCSIDEINDAVRRVLDSDVIGQRSRLRGLLEYIVEEEVENRGDRLKAFAIGIDVLGRGEDFDPNTDSIVRVEVNRLRTLLQDYYASVGQDDDVVIEIPRGSYRPTFRPAVQLEAEAGRRTTSLADAALPFAIGATLGFVIGLGICVGHANL